MRESVNASKRRSAALYEKGAKINVHHHHHVHFKVYFLQCIPLSFAIHILGILDMALGAMSFIFYQQSHAKAQLE